MIKRCQPHPHRCRVKRICKLCPNKTCSSLPWCHSLTLRRGRKWPVVQTDLWWDRVKASPFKRSTVTTTGTSQWWRLPRHSSQIYSLKLPCHQSMAVTRVVTAAAINNSSRPKPKSSFSNVKSKQKTNCLTIHFRRVSRDVPRQQVPSTLSWSTNLRSGWWC